MTSTTELAHFWTFSSTQVCPWSRSFYYLSAPRLLLQNLKSVIWYVFATDGIAPTADNAGVTRVRFQVWWDIALQSSDQLRQKFAWALSQIFVTRGSGNGFNNNDADFSGSASWLGPTNYYDDLLVDNAFCNYRDLLTDMTLSPVMGTSY